MFASIKSFLYRHRRKFIVSGAVIGGVVLTVKLFERKFLDWQEKDAKELLDKLCKQHHFQSTEKTCNKTIISLSIPLKEAILKCADTEELLSKLKNGAENKLVIWEELKIRAFVQHSALLYSGLILTIVLRVQLNIMGGYLCRNTVTTSSEQFDSNLQESYLSLCHHFIQNGAKELCALIEKHVRIVLKDMELSKKVSLKDLEQIFWSIQTSIIGDPNDPLKNIPRYAFPSLKSIDMKPTYLQKIVEETAEVLESDEVKSLAASCLGRSYSNSVDHIAEYYIPTNSVSALNNIQNRPNFPNISDLVMPVAKIIPILHGLNLRTNIQGYGDPWIEQFLLADKVLTFGANIYEAYCHSA